MPEALIVGIVRQAIETAIAVSIRRALKRNGITAPGGATIDHVELFGPPTVPPIWL